MLLAPFSAKIIVLHIDFFFSRIPKFGQKITLCVSLCLPLFFCVCVGVGGILEMLHLEV